MGPSRRTRRRHDSNSSPNLDQRRSPLPTIHPSSTSTHQLIPPSPTSSAMASAGAKAGRSFFKSESSRQALYVYEGATADSSQVLAWIPVGIFFTRHVYSVATVTGVSMQVRYKSPFLLLPAS